MADTASTGTQAHQRLPHLPALDGLRALALLGVMGFHGGISWLRGGYLPLTVFFTLSGFLIASLLLLEVDATGRIDLKTFWVRRARRLVPAALLGVGAAMLYGAVSEPSTLTRLRGDALSALGWVTNWRFVLQGRSYSESFSVPSPLQHYWSLAVEEQFYLTFPLVLVGLIAVSRGRRWVVAAGVAAMAVASAVWMAVLYTPAGGPLRPYYGTDARAAELLVGVLLAIAMIGPNGLRRFESRLVRRAIDAAGLIALGVTLTLWVIVHEFSSWLFEGGMAGLAVLAAAIVLAGTQPGTVVSRIVGIQPLALLGKISYGSYVVHWPVFLYLNPARTGLDGVSLFTLRFAVVMILATASYWLLEQPVRLGRVLRSKVGAIHWANASIGLAAGVALVTSSTSALPTVTLRTAGEALPPPPPIVAQVSAAATPSGAQPITPSTAAPTTAAPTTSSSATPGTLSVAVAAPATTSPSAPATTVATAPPPAPPTKILIIGDSLGQNMATGLTRWGKRANVVVWDHAIAACPVTRGGDRRTMSGSYDIPANCDWWGTATAQAEIDKWDPDVILMVGGLNDLFDRKVDGWSRYYSPGDAAFDSWMLEEYGLAAEALGRERPLAWAPPPCLDWTPYAPHILPEEGENRRIHHNGQIVPKLFKGSPFVHHADLDEQLCPNGSFDRHVMGNNSRPDGLHLSDEAAERLAEQWLGPLLLGLKKGASA